MHFRLLRLLDISIGAAIVGLAGYLVWSANVPHLTVNGNCSKYGQEHQLSLTGDAFSAKTIVVGQCDQLKVTNFDTQDYELAFGEHDHHAAYTGFEETLLQPGKSTTIHLIKAGTYPLHDHLRDKAVITVTITPL